MSDIPRYRPNPGWFWWRFCFWDDPKGKFCEYRDYEKLKAEFEFSKTNYDRLLLYTFSLENEIREMNNKDEQA